MVIIQWWLHKRLSVTIQERMGCIEGDAIVRAIVDFKEPDFHVRLPSFKMFSWLLLLKLESLFPPLSFTGLPHI